MVENIMKEIFGKKIPGYEEAVQYVTVYIDLTNSAILLRLLLLCEVKQNSLPTKIFQFACKVSDLM